jgi:hypothetical protein
MWHHYLKTASQLVHTVRAQEKLAHKIQVPMIEVNEAGGNEVDKSLHTLTVVEYNRTT